MITAAASAAVRDRLVGLWRVPLYRTGYLLLLAQLVTGALGLAFWLVVARMYPPTVVGTNSAAIAAVQLLGGIAALNMSSGLVRFIPGAPSRARTMIGVTAAVTTGAAVAAAGIFLMGLSVWSPGLSALFTALPLKLWFIGATVVLTLLNLVPPALVAMGKPDAVPVVYGAFGAGKVALAAGAAVTLPIIGIWTSWTVASAVALVGAVGYLVLRALPGFVAGAPATRQLPARRDVLSYVGWDYVGFVCWFGAVTLTPLLVFNLAGASRGAVFTIAWAVGVTLYEVASAFGQSQLASGALSPGHLEVHYRQSLRQVMLLLSGPVLVILVGAPQLLALFGPFYPLHGATALRLLALSSLPNAVLTLEIARARVLRRLRAVAVGLAVMCAGALGTAAWLVPLMGIEGAGIAWLAAMTAGAAAAAAWHYVRGPRTAGIDAADGRGRRPDGIAAVVADATGRRIDIDRRVRVVTETTLLLVRADASPAVLKMSTGERGGAEVARETVILTRLQGNPALGSWRDLLPSVLSSGVTPSGAFLLMSRLAGTTPAQPSDALTVAALDAIAALHELHGARVAVDDRLLDEWVRRPARLVHDALSTSRQRARLDLLVTGLCGQLIGARTNVGWVHGDFCRGNVLTGTGPPPLCGIVDWAQAHDGGLIALDTAQWLLADGRNAHRGLGRDVASRLSAASWSAAEWRLLAADADEIPGSAVLRLAWLHHVANNLTKSRRYEASPLWIHKTVLPVLKAVAP